MFEYGISLSTIFWSIVTLILTSAVSFAASIIIHSECSNGNKKEKIISTLIIIGLWILMFSCTWVIFHDSQKK